jgi:ATP-dependent protease HslVU (ClpYQ) peptidase subunit
MTVCIAAMCEQGNAQGAKVVCATDGMLSHVVSADVKAPKMLFFGDWIFMFAGQLSNADLMMDELRPLKFPAQEIKTLVRRAYRKRMSQWSADRYLLQYDVDMDEFKKDGRNIFGDERFGELSRSIDQDAVNYQEQVVTVGWAASKSMPIFFGMSRDGLQSHALDGLAAIGSGAEVAMSTMLVLGQNRSMTLEETIYSVSSAKFAAEGCEGVGKTTTMYVSWKRTENDPPNRPSGNFVHPPQIDELRRVWDKYGKPRIPTQALPLTHKITVGLWEGRGRNVGLEHLMLMQSAYPKAKRRKQKSESPDRHQGH